MQEEAQKKKKLEEEAATRAKQIEQDRAKLEQERKQKQQEFKASAVATTSNKQFPQSAIDLCNQGVAAFGKKDFATAIDAMTKAINEAPHMAQAFMSRAIAYMQSRKNNEAVQDFTKCLSLVEYDDQEKDKAIRCLSLRGKTLRQLGKYDEALSDLSKAILLAPVQSQATIYLDRGILVLVVF